MKELILQTGTLIGAIFCGASGFVQFSEERYGWATFLLVMCSIDAFVFVARMLNLM